MGETKLKISQSEYEELKNAKYLLENPGIVAKMTDLIGRPIEKGFEMLPKEFNDKIGSLTQSALNKAIDAAIFTMDSSSRNLPYNKLHKFSAAAAGGISGFFGLPALAIELPITTTMMLRSIADIARSEGENIDDIETKLACIEVFALGGTSKDDDGSESGYFAVRAALSQSVTKAAEYVAAHGLSDKGAPALLRLIVSISERFGIQVTEKAAAQAIPMIGAAGGAIINTIFMDHFQDMAKGHFVIRRLEKQYGIETIKEMYSSIND